MRVFGSGREREMGEGIYSGWKKGELDFLGCGRRG